MAYVLKFWTYINLDEQFSASILVTTDKSWTYLVYEKIVNRKKISFSPNFDPCWNFENWQDLLLNKIRVFGIVLKFI